MKLNLGTDIYCPKCKREMLIETGFWSALLCGSLVKTVTERFKKEGGKITCPYCKTISIVAPNKA